MNVACGKSTVAKFLAEEKGVTVACGKSTVATFLAEEKGVAVLDCDKLGLLWGSVLDCDKLG
ncbi:hypothetical protein T484DRAFT_1860301 [Baffinella frigidus]|nr:hypothetical protein T484DRAFT_1860301 [Cryptophyta sp. CCMP2293]